MTAPRNRLYVGNIPFNANDATVRAFFDGFKVLDVKIIMDRETNQPRGFCFVEVDSPAAVKEAIEKLSNQDMGGRRVIVSEAKEKERPAGNGDRRDNRRSY